MTNLDLSSVMRRYEASRQLCLRYANLHPDEKMACGTALQKVRTLPAITHHLADLLDDMAIVLGLVPPPVEPRAPHPIAIALREMADSQDAQDPDDMIAFTPTALRRFADQIDALNRSEPSADLGGCSIACSGCGKETVLRYTDSSKTHVSIESVTGWTYDSKDGVRCPSCNAV